MKLNFVGGVIAAVVLLALILGYGSLFTVYQTRQALVVRLGQPVRVVTEPGLNFKIPLIDSVIHIDKRILDIENPAAEVIASDQKRLVVDAFARYKITKPLLFYQTVGSIEGANASTTRRFWSEAITSCAADSRSRMRLSMVMTLSISGTLKFSPGSVTGRIGCPSRTTSAWCRWSTVNIEL